MSAWEQWINNSLDTNGLDRMAVQLRAMQFFAHIAHNEVSGTSFHEDHEFLGELYATYETGYDDLVERMIGLGKTPNLWTIASEANSDLQGMRTQGLNFEWYKKLLTAEKDLCGFAETLIDTSISEATRNLISQLADDS